MSVAFKCDKCGTCFDPAQNGIEFMRIDGFAIKSDKTYKEGTTIYQKGVQHLCPLCMNEFLDWFDVSKEILKMRIATDQKEKGSIATPADKFRLKTSGDLLSEKDLKHYCDRLKELLK